MFAAGLRKRLIFICFRFHFQLLGTRHQSIEGPAARQKVRYHVRGCSRVCPIDFTKDFINSTQKDTHFHPMIGTKRKKK